VSRPFTAGERAMLVDSRGRRYLVNLRLDGQFHTHSGVVDHRTLIDRPEGSEVRSSSGARFVALRPTLAETVLKMPRGAQVIYPKDLAAMLMVADVGVGSRVLEAGVGSGALSMALLQSGARVVGYEVREDFARTARANVASFLGDEVHYCVEERDIYDGITESGMDSVMLDLPEPWRVLAHAEGALRPGGILVSYLPTINQVSQLRSRLDASRFAMAETLEVLHRTWHVTERSVRPDHRMVAHTGFITHARLLDEP
jgi:tRNA (adenine57-N1/adenine58-N1)-methyltransferase